MILIFLFIERDQERNSSKMGPTGGLGCFQFFLIRHMHHFFIWELKSQWKQGNPVVWKREPWRGHTDATVDFIHARNRECMHKCKLELMVSWRLSIRCDCLDFDLRSRRGRAKSQLERPFGVIVGYQFPRAKDCFTVLIGKACPDNKCEN